MLKLVFVDDRGNFVMRRYEHDRRGVVETLVRGNLIVIRPGFEVAMSQARQLWDSDGTADA